MALTHLLPSLPKILDRSEVPRWAIIMFARAQIMGHRTYHNPICMPSLMLPEFLPAAETCRTDVYAIPNLADRVCAFYPNRMGEIAGASVTLDLKTRFVHGWG